MVARVLIAQDRPDQAIALLERLQACALAQDRAGSLLEIQALQALAQSAGAKVEGPAVIEEPNATTFIHPGDVATVSEHGHLVIDVKL